MNFDLASAAASRLVLLTGEEATLRVRAMKDLVAIHEAEGDEFDRETHVSDGNSLRNLIGAVGTSPFLSPNRVALLRNVLREDIDIVKGLSPELKALPATARLILVADEEGGEAAGRNRKPLEKVVKDAGGMILAFTIDPKQAVNELRAESEKRGKKLSLNAARILLDMVGGSYSAALEELDKLELYTADAPTISEADIEKVTTASREYNVYKLTDAIVGQRPAEALRQLAILAGGGTKMETAVIAGILPQMLRQIRLIYQAKHIQEAGGIEKVAGDLPDNPAFAKLQDWQQRPAADAARKLSHDQILQLMKLIADTDARAKGLIDSSNSSREHMELLILQATQLAR